MGQPVVVSSVQFDVRNPENLQENISFALHHAYDAARRGAKIIVLPELCLSGPNLDLDLAFSLSQESDGPHSGAFCLLAKRYNVHVVFGYIELCDGKLYNSAAIVGPNGLCGNVRKRCLEGGDFIWAVAGNEMASPVVICNNLRVGILISHDVANYKRDPFSKKISHPFYKEGMLDVVCVPCAWSEGFYFPDSRWVGLAEELRSSVIVSNLVFKDSEFGGGSCIIDKKLKIWTNGSSRTSPAVVGGIVEI